MACISPPPSCSETHSKNCPSVFVSNALIELILCGERSPTSSSLSLMKMDELLKHVKDYILKNKLYDEQNPLKILLHENELGSLLGKNEVSLFDVKDVLLEKFVFPVTPSGEKNSSEVICSISDKMCISKKRKLDNFGDLEFSANKREKKQKESCLDFDCDEKSIHSYQDCDAECADFTSKRDERERDKKNFSLCVNKNLIFAETFDVDVEYEIESDGGSGTSEREYESDNSDLEDFVKTAIIKFIAETTDTDLEYLADLSSDFESEKELSDEDKWQCTSCGKKSHPLMRCCSYCWRTRAGWLSERSETGENERDPPPRKSKRKDFLRSKKRKFSKKKKSKKKGSSNHKLSDLPTVPEIKNSSPSTCNFDSSDVIPSQSPNRLESELKKELCMFCCSKPADSTILHGKVACQVCCFSCGKKIFAENDRCPVCRRIIERIVYVYNL